MPTSVLDSYAVLAFLLDEPGADIVADLFVRAAEAHQAVLISSVNWAEVRYQVERKRGRIRWDDAGSKLLGLPLEIVPVDQAMAELAGEIKASRKMSLADCFAAALAKQKKAELVTGDQDFRQVEGELRGVVWL